MSHSNQMRQQQQQIITTPQIQPHNGPTSVHGRLTNTQQRSAIRNVVPVVINSAIETIDLSSQPSSPAPTPLQDAPHSSNNEFIVINIPERTEAQDSTNNAAYKVNNLSYLLILLN